MKPNTPSSLVFVTRAACVAAAISLLAQPSATHGQVVAPSFAANYTAVNLGSVPGLPGFYGGLTLLDGDVNTLLIGGSANGPSGAIYSVGLTRDVDGHITGFSGPATHFADAPYIDGGLAYGPDGVLFYTGYPTNTLGQIKPGSTAPDKVINLAAEGVAHSVGALGFVPATHPGAGQFKLLSYNSYNWYTGVLTPDGSGTFDLTSVILETTIVGGPEGFVYVPLGSPDFANPTVLVSEYQAGKVGAYDVDANGDPILGTRRDFLTGLGGAEGAFIDPVTGDFLFSTFGGGDRVVAVRGFAQPEPPSVPDHSATSFLLAGGLAALALARFRHRA